MNNFSGLHRESNLIVEKKNFLQRHELASFLLIILFISTIVFLKEDNVEADHVAQTPDWEVDGQEFIAHFGDRSAHGDFNGDGFSDVVISAPFYRTDEAASMVFVWYGSSSGFRPSLYPLDADWYVKGGKWYDSESQGLHFDARFEGLAAGDVNGDGYDDVLVHDLKYNTDETDALDPEGAIFVWFGNFDGLGPVGDYDNADWMILNERSGDLDNNNFRVANLESGDLNGDGYDEVIYSYSTWDGDYYDQGHITIYSGSANPGPFSDHTDADIIILGSEEQVELGTSLSIGDVNGDNFDDLFVGAFHQTHPTEIARRSYLWFGSNEFPGGSVVQTNENSALYEFYGGNSGIDISSDYDADGFDDVSVALLSTNYHLPDHERESAVFVWYSRNLPAPGLVELETADWNVFGGSVGDDIRHFFNVGDGGDTNGDGYDDLVSGGAHRNLSDCPNPPGCRTSYVWLGSQTGLVPSDENPESAHWKIDNLESNTIPSGGGHTVAIGDVTNIGCESILETEYLYTNNDDARGNEDHRNEGQASVFYCELSTPECGNYIAETGEQCDDGANGDDTDQCTDSCTFTYCGDGIVQQPNGLGNGGTRDDGYEMCDDGNTVDDDECSNSCVLGGFGGNDGGSTHRDPARR